MHAGAKQYEGQQAMLEPCTDARLTVKLFGGCEIRVDDKLLALPTRHCALILAFLSAEYDTEHSRSRVANLFWSDRAEEQARGSLRQALYQLRKAFEPFGFSPVISTAKSIRLNRSLVWCDAHDLQNNKTDALSHFRGDLLLGWEISAPEFTDWLSEKRSKLRSNIANLSRTGIDDAEQIGDLAALTQHTQRLMLLDPYGEEHVRRLMNVHARKGEFAQAIDAYRRLEQRLQSDLQVRPSNESRALLDEIERHANGKTTSPTTGRDRQHASEESITQNGSLRGSSFRTSLPDECRQLTVVAITMEETETGRSNSTLELIAKRMELLRSEVETVTREYGGYSEQSSGMAFFVYFGWPEMHEDTTEVAVRAAVELREKLDGETETRCRIGISTGDVLISDAVKNIIGGPPNHALQLMGWATAGEILVADQTRLLLNGKFDFEELAFQGRFSAFRYERTVPVHEEPQPEATELVGRNRELEMLLDRWRTASVGEGQLVIIKGEPGVGKSLLTQTFLKEVKNEYAKSICLQCSRRMTERPLHSIGEHIILAANLDLTKDPRSNWHKLDSYLESSGVASEEDRNVIGYCAGVTSLRNPMDGLSVRNSVQRALANYLTGHTKSGPVIVRVEDVQWIDPTTLGLLQHVSASLPQYPLMLLLTARPSFNSSCFEAYDPTDFSLTRLPRASIAKLVRKLGCRKNISEIVLEAICERSDGVPLFAEELVNNTFAPGPGNGIVPTSLKDILVARLNRLGDLRHFAFRAACLGRRFSKDQLELVCSNLPGTIDFALAKMLEARLVYQFPGFGPDTYYFKHALLRDAAYESIPTATRATIHQTIYESLAAKKDSKNDLLAWHARHAGDHQKAVLHLRAAAAETLGKFAHSEARTHVEQALRLIEQEQFEIDMSETRLALLCELARCYAHTYGFGHVKTAAVVDTAIDRSAEAPGNPIAARVLWQSYCVHHIRANHREIRRLGEELLNLGSWDDAVGIQQVVGRRVIAVAEFLSGDFSAATSKFEQAMELTGVSPDAPSIGGATDVDQLISMKLITIRILAIQGHAKKAILMLREIEEISRRTGHPQNQITTFASAAYVYLMLDQYHAACKAAEAACELAKKFNLSMWEAYSDIMLALPNLYLSASAENIERYDCARDLLKSSSAQFSVLLCDAHFALLLARQGHQKRALRLSSELLMQVDAGNEPWCHPEVIRLAIEAKITAAPQVRIEIGNWLDRALKIADQQKSELWQGRIRMTLRSLD
ncbi:AAA family ATPase [Roseibium album]|uniref:AAA family ATPase n=1 Tax=Roseibium album TaxID=311410 RepID=UPI00249196F6|nr:AAA family ATPase [Roseibium album]